jgi:predicted RNA binding protein YcfA (HicA-like mRNA interferase family)
MRTYSGKQICLILNKFGFENVRQKGSHVIMQKKFISSTISIPVPMHKELAIGTLLSIIRQSGIDKSEFE